MLFLVAVLSSYYLPLPSMFSALKTFLGGNKSEVSDELLARSFYDLSAKKADGSLLEFKSLAGAPVICVNVASECGLTNAQYKLLLELVDKYEQLKVLAFPCAQFMNQEHKDPTKVEACMMGKAGLHTKRKVMGTQFIHMEMVRVYGTFPTQLSQVDVNGPTASPVFQWLRAHSELYNAKSRQIAPITWNFGKFVLSKSGRSVVLCFVYAFILSFSVVKYFAPSTVEGVEQLVMSLLK